MPGRIQSVLGANVLIMAAELAALVADVIECVDVCQALCCSWVSADAGSSPSP